MSIWAGVGSGLVQRPPDCARHGSDAAQPHSGFCDPAGDCRFGVACGVGWQWCSTPPAAPHRIDGGIGTTVTAVPCDGGHPRYLSATPTSRSSSSHAIPTPKPGAELSWDAAQQATRTGTTLDFGRDLPAVCEAPLRCGSRRHPLHGQWCPPMPPPPPHVCVSPPILHT